MCNLIECSDNYSYTTMISILYQYYKDDSRNDIAQSESFKYKVKTTGETPATGNTKDVEAIVPLTFGELFKRH